MFGFPVSFGYNFPCSRSFLKIMLSQRSFPLDYRANKIIYLHENRAKKIMQFYLKEYHDLQISKKMT